MHPLRRGREKDQGIITVQLFKEVSDSEMVYVPTERAHERLLETIDHSQDHWQYPLEYLPQERRDDCRHPLWSHGDSICVHLRPDVEQFVRGDWA